jgi:hypothetical protein
MALSYDQVKAALSKAIAGTIPPGGTAADATFVPFDLTYYSDPAHNPGINTPIYSNGQLVYVPLSAFSGDPLQHYVQYGATQNFAPNSWFDPVYYRAHYADVNVLTGADLLVQYATNGVNEGRATTPELAIFNGARYLQDNPDVTTWVNAHLSDFKTQIPNTNPPQYVSDAQAQIQGSLAHYIKFGASEGRLAFDLSGNPEPYTTFAHTADLAKAVTVDAAHQAVDLVLNTNNGHTLLTGTKAVADGTTNHTLRLTGDTDVRIDITNPANQITGIDLNHKNGIETNGIENNVSGAGIFTASNFTVFDAYARNPLSTIDRANNFLGNIYFDGTGFSGDGKSTNGNIFLGGLGADTAFGGTGNDFLAGGGHPTVNAVTPGGGDVLHGGRNADFFFAQLAALNPADGNNNVFDGGTTADDTAAGTNAGQAANSTQNNDWILVEAADDNEPTTIDLQNQAGGTGSGLVGNLSTASGTLAGLYDIENINASGNLYGFLNDVAVAVGQRATDTRLPAPVIGTENYGEGSTAQLNINGSNAGNTVIGGYDNDVIVGNDGSDLLFGGDLRYLETYKNNPNLLDANGGLNLNVRTATLADGSTAKLVNDGSDSLYGDAAPGVVVAYGNDDNIVFEEDGGKVFGGGDKGTASGADKKDTGDTLWLTNYSEGRLQGAVASGETTTKNETDTLSKLTKDSVIRFDLGNNGVTGYKGYGGSNDITNQDQTNLSTGLKAVAVTGIESVIATGLGAIDYKAAGGNSPELKFSNQQNYFGINADLSLRGSNADNTLYANTGNDIIEGRGGDDNLSGGTGNDTFIFALGDGVDNVWRQKDTVDANGTAGADNIWDTDATGKGLFVQDFRAPQTGDIASSKLTVNFGATDLTSPNVAVTSFYLKIGGVPFNVPNDNGQLSAAKSLTALAAVVNAAYQAQDPNVSVIATTASNTLTVVDKLHRTISSSPADGFGVAIVSGNSSFSTIATYIPGGTPTNIVENDVIVFKDYADRTNNVGTDATKFQINQAAQLVTKLGADGSHLANTQNILIRVNDAGQGDKVTITVNGKDYSYTATAGDGSAGVVAGLVNAINSDLDTNSAAGKLVATLVTLDAANFPNVPTGTLTGAQFSLTEQIVGGSQTYITVTTSVTNSATGQPGAVVSTHDQSNGDINLVGFDGRNGNLNGSDVTFQGLTTDSVSLLQTAKDPVAGSTVGETLTGKDANAVAGNAAVKWINGDDLLIGGKGDDTINGGTGDDRILASPGKDTVDGGGNGSSPAAFTDTLQAEESAFGAGTVFTVKLDSTLGATGKGNLDAKAPASGLSGSTDFTNIEVVRVLENNRQTTLDVKDLSNSIATAVGSNPIIGGANPESLTVNLTLNDASIYYTVDVNNNGVIDTGIGNPGAGVDYNKFQTTAVFGEENVTAGGANDTVNIDQSQNGANNKIDLGGQQDNTVVGSLAKGFDTVNYTTTATGPVDTGAASAQPTLTLKVLAAGNSTVTAGSGATAPTDTLTSVEHINFNGNSASNTAYADVLDVSAISGATVNLGAAVTVGKSAGGANALDTVDHINNNTLDAGGVSGATLGVELVTIGNATRFERVLGSAGNDRVIVANTLLAGPGVNSALTVNTGYQYFTGTPAPVFADIGLYQYDLAAGNNDILDYRQETTGGVLVSVDTTATATVPASHDLVIRVNDNTVEYADNVERYFGGTNNNFIDLSAATVDTTVQFSKEAYNNATPNEFAEPNGDTVNDGTLDLTRGNQVRDTAAGTVFATFVDRTAVNATGPSFWNVVYGAAKNETVILTDNEVATAHVFNLGAGQNVADYTALSAAVTANIGSVNTASADLEQTSFINADRLSQFHSATDPNASYATITGSALAGDTANVTGLVFSTPTGSGLGNAATATLSNVAPQYHVVDLGSGIVQEDLYGQYGATPASAKPAGFVTHLASFENATNAGDADAVHLIGSTAANTLIGGNAADELTGGNGKGALPNSGDTLTGNGGADWFIYNNETNSPGGGVTTGQQSAATFGAGAAGDTAVINSRDTITDFVHLTDKLVFNLTDSYNAVHVAGTLPANLATGALNSVAPITPGFAVGETTLDIPVTNTGAVSGQVANYDIANTGVTLTVADLILRVAGSSLGDVIDASAGLSNTFIDQTVAGGVTTDGLRVDIVYNAASDSTGSTSDTIIHFTSGQDKIDLSFLKAPEWAVSFGSDFDKVNGANALVAGGDGQADAIQGIRTLAVNPAISGGTGLFIDSNGAERAVAVYTTQDGNNSPTTSVFVDANHDGNYTAGTDLLVNLVGTQSVTAADFIFNHY